MSDEAILAAAEKISGALNLVSISIDKLTEAIEYFDDEEHGISSCLDSIATTLENEWKGHSSRRGS